MSSHPYTIPSREDILGLLRSTNKAQDAASIAKALGLDDDKIDGLMRRLGAMERDGQLHAEPGGRYSLARGDNQIEGRVSSHRDGYGFLIPDEGGADLFLSEKEMQKVFHGDRVRVRQTGVDRRGRPEGSIIEVLERANTHIIGRLLKENGNWVIAPEDKRISRDILLAGSPGKAKTGHVVSVELIEQPTRYSQPTGRIVEVLGEIDDPGMEIEIAVRKYGVPHEFSAAALAQSAALPDGVQPSELAGRIDLRDVPLVTIDGEDARDFDDAVYCEPTKIGRSAGFRLIVAIADVSHYVKPNDDLDKDALERSTSVYFPRRVIPMLPEKLSNGLCSLNPGVDRLTLVCDALINAKGKVHAYQFYPAVIHSAARLTYTEVAAALGNTRGLEATRLAPLMPPLQSLYALYQTLYKARQQRGAIDFDTVETQIVINESGKIEQILPRLRNDAHRLIEECMLAANVCAADLLTRSKHPGVFRIHAGPTEEKLNQVRSFLKLHGLNLGGGDTPAASDYADLMKHIRVRPDALLLQTMVLRSMQQAVYSPDNIGHFGLSYEAYAHFTSPIRRYPDLLTHRVIKSVLQGKTYHPNRVDMGELNTMQSPAAKRLHEQSKAKEKEKDKERGGKKGPSELAVWEALGIHCSANERRADEASRDVEAWLKCYFIRDKLGEEFTGTISGVTSFGIFVQLDALFIEGLVHVTELGADYYQYDEMRHELRGERTGIRYQLTDRVTVQVSRVDLDARRIDLRLVSEPGIKTQLRNEARRAESGRQERSASTEQHPSARSAGKKGAAAGKVRTEAKQGGAKTAKSAKSAEGAKSAQSAAGKPAKSAGKSTGASKSASTQRTSQRISSTSRKNKPA